MTDDDGDDPSASRYAGHDAPTVGPDDEVLVDARGLKCPLPIIRLAATAKTLATGTVVAVLSTDVAAEPDVAAWCRMRGAELLDQVWTDGVLRSRVRVG